MGDPAGIGLEIAAKAWAALRRSGPAFALIADPEAVRATGAPVQAVADIREAPGCFPEALPVLERALARAAAPGRPDPANAEAILDSIRQGVALALAGAAGGLVTLPIAKHVLYQAGFAFPGHTEFIADLSGAETPVMMLAGPSLRVALASIHVPLRAAPDLITRERLLAVARVTLQALSRDFGIAQPRLAIAGLNPHAGEAGALGREELEVINPAAAELRAEGFDVTDARPADSLFHAEARATYDAALAMTHDQGLIPIKTLHFWDAVNLTLGLPIVRASPDHGVGFDIAGRGLARPDSLIAALRLASELAARREA